MIIFSSNHFYFSKKKGLQILLMSLQAFLVYYLFMLYKITF